MSCVVSVRPPPQKKKSSLYPLSPTLTGSLWVPRCNAAPSTRWGRFTDAGTAQGNARRSPSLVSRVSPPPKKKNHPKLDIWIPEEEEDGLTPSLPRTPGGRQHIPGLSAGYWGYWGAGEYGGGAWVRVGGGGGCDWALGGELHPEIGRSGVKSWRFCPNLAVLLCHQGGCTPKLVFLGGIQEDCPPPPPPPNMTMSRGSLHTTTSPHPGLC